MTVEIMCEVLLVKPHEIVCLVTATNFRLPQVVFPIGLFASKKLKKGSEFRVVLTGNPLEPKDVLYGATPNQLSSVDVKELRDLRAAFKRRIKELGPRPESTWKASHPSEY